MAAITESYSRLYNEKLKEASCCIRPCTRTTLKIVGLVTLVILLVVGFISAYAFSSPLSSIGTIGHLVGQSGIIAGIAIGFAGFVIGSVALYIYLKKSIFRVADYINEDKGFLYAVKNSEGKVKAYLYGTLSSMPKHWQGFNNQVLSKLAECRKVIVICHQNTPSNERGPNFNAIDYARAHSGSLELDQFENPGEQMGNLRTFLIEMAKDVKDNKCSVCCRCCFMCCSSNQEEGSDRQVVTWQTGNETEMPNLFLSLTNGKEVDSVGANTRAALKNLIDMRSSNWMPKINHEFGRLDEQPVFIAVDSVYLFDSPSHDITGLKTRLQDAGWAVERVAYP